MAAVGRLYGDRCQGDLAEVRALTAPGGHVHNAHTSLPLRNGAPMSAQLNRCSRCLATYTTAPYLMAGRPYCCQSCSVGSACEHQGVRRAVTVRRYDSNFDRFREAAHHRSPYETVRPDPR
jgi:hypothetical protein